MPGRALKEGGRAAGDAATRRGTGVWCRRWRAAAAPRGCTAPGSQHTAFPGGMRAHMHDIMAPDAALQLKCGHEPRFERRWCTGGPLSFV